MSFDDARLNCPTRHTLCVVTHWGQQASPGPLGPGRCPAARTARRAPACATPCASSARCLCAWRPFQRMLKSRLSHMAHVPQEQHISGLSRSADGHLLVAQARIARWDTAALWLAYRWLLRTRLACDARVGLAPFWAVSRLTTPTSGLSPQPVSPSRRRSSSRAAALRNQQHKLATVEIKVVRPRTAWCTCINQTCKGLMRVVDNSSGEGTQQV